MYWHFPPTFFSKDNVFAAHKFLKVFATSAVVHCSSWFDTAIHQLLATWLVTVGESKALQVELLKVPHSFTRSALVENQ